MIRKLVVEGVTVFPKQESFSFVPGLNIIVGGNDSGKSHLMKLCYAITKWGCGGARRELPEVWAEEKRLRRDLLRVFGTQNLTGLTARNRGNGRASIRASLEGNKVPPGTAELEFGFTAGKEEEGLHINKLPQRFLHENAVFISPREVLSIYPCYMQAGKRYPELLDSASWELCRALEDEPGSEPIPGELNYVIRQIETLLSGRLQRLNGRFYLHRGGQEPLELNLVAEGFKRIGTLGLLIGNGTIKAGTALFWDEPEMNLNTIHLPLLVRILMGLCHAGVQVMLTTHSLFLLRELVIQLAEKRNKSLNRRFFGMQPALSATSGVRTSVGSTPDEIDHIDSLDAEMEQADRYLNMNLQPGEPE
ncbi:MAG: AAA family ATPase [Akkermansia sp.]|nr:AAA family ATPase [Akkermansia sp.]MDO4752210.1 AAA family ATPase [Akkermansia sp.]